jgi:hypothetical protein
MLRVVSSLQISGREKKVIRVFQQKKKKKSDELQ